MTRIGPPTKALLLLALCAALCPAAGSAAPKAVSTADLETPAPGTISAANKRALTPLIRTIAEKRGVDPDLVHAVIAAESGYNPTAVSPKGAVGLMQIMPATAADYGVTAHEQLLDPGTNVRTGTRHLKRLLDKYKSVGHAVMAYNAGEGALDRAGLALDYPETRAYTLRVLGNYWRSKGRAPTGLAALGLPRPRLIIRSTVSNLDPGLHAIGPDSKPMFVIERKAAPGP